MGPTRTPGDRRGHRSKDGPPSCQLDVTRRLCRDVAAQTTPLSLEQLISSLLGEIWTHRWPGADSDGVDAMFRAGQPVLDSLAELGTPAAKATLAAIGQLDRGLLGHCARRLAASLDGTSPGWLEKMGTAKIDRAFSDHRPREGEALLLEVLPPSGDSHMLAVFITARMGGIAKHLDLVGAMDPIRAPADGLRFVELDPELACQRVRAAIERADATPDPEVSGEFIYYRALALARVQPPRPVGWVPGAGSREAPGRVPRALDE